MVSPIIYVFVAVPIVIAVAFISLWLRTRGQWLKCPECGEVFKAPATDQKTVGAGPVPAGIGSVVCPKCGNARARRHYLKAAPPASKGGS